MYLVEIPIQMELMQICFHGNLHLRYWIIVFVVAHLSTSSSCSLVFVQLWEISGVLGFGILDWFSAEFWSGDKWGVKIWNLDWIQVNLSS